MRSRTPRLALLAAAAALLAVPPVADSVARHRAEGRLADRLVREQPSLTARPDVSIEGTPFLLQAARGSHPQVRVRADATSDGRPVTAEVTLDDVSPQGGGHRAASASGRFTAGYDALGGPDGATVSDAGDGRLRIERSLLMVTAVVELHDGVVSLRPTAVSLAGRPLDPAGPLVTRSLAGRTRTLPELPLEMRATGVSAGPDGITVTASAKDVALA
ncbi:DUF2993 domain-containing protein [Streptomyces bambusae]|uniref:LmeA family phospholipid-binding protein n=1 Tax=Streptomyces bambusae TaxID=1550616 RepID=UPI001CFDD6CE|nr:DUF2993 domain-containing protein [Streptomyces bambusae]MCB5168071.1 DUF2993 domain-containing protein [Streptomyces bambusae]